MPLYCPIYNWDSKRNLLEEFEDTKEVIRICNSKKNKQYNGQKKKDKRTNTYLQNTTQKIKGRATQTPL